MCVRCEPSVGESNFKCVMYQAWSASYWACKVRSGMLLEMKLLVVKQRKQAYKSAMAIVADKL